MAFTVRYTNNKIVVFDHKTAKMYKSDLIPSDQAESALWLAQSQLRQFGEPEQAVNTVSSAHSIR